MDSLKSYGAQTWNQSMTFLNSDGLVPQLVLTVVIVLVIHFLILGVESLIRGIQKYDQLSATLLPDTHISKGSGNQSKIVINQGKGSDYPFMYPSENELNGIEFSYSFHLYIDPDNYSTTRTARPTGALSSETSLRTIFYKGAETGPWPMSGPGVFLHQETNTMRIYMNCVKPDQNASQYVEIPNMPIGKWFHVVITMKGQNMDVYLNGNIAVRHSFTYIPMVNYGNIYTFPMLENLKSKPADVVYTTDSIQGMISRLKYYSYAISFSQIDTLYNEGASKKIVSTSFDFKPPYLHDSWWVTRFNPASAHYGL